MFIHRRKLQLLAAALVLSLSFSASTSIFFSVYADDPPPEPAAEEQVQNTGASEVQTAQQEPDDQDCAEALPPEESAPADIPEPSAEPSQEGEPPSAQEPEGEIPESLEPAGEEPGGEERAGAAADAQASAADESTGGETAGVVDEPLQLEDMPATAPPVQLPDPYYYYDGTKYEHTTFAAAILEMSANNRTPDDHTLYAESDTFVENVEIDGSDWTDTPETLMVVSEGDSSDTTISGTFTVQNMLNFLLQGFTITGGITASGNTGTLTLDDVITSSTAGDGIVIDGQDGEVVLDGVQADSNTGVGASITNTAGSAGVSITDSTFNDNNTTPDDGMQGGLQVVSNGEVVLENVEASHNQDGDGAAISADGITISGGSFNVNTSPEAGYGNGIYGSSTGGAITLDGVEASGNEETGAALSFTSDNAGNEILVKFSTFEGNHEYGVWAQPESGTVTFKCNTFCNNTLGPRMVPVDETVIYLKCPCTCEDEEKPEYLGVKLSETEPTIVNPGNGTLVIIPAIERETEEVEARVKVLALFEKELPAELAEEDIFLAGLDILLLNAMLPDDAYENEEHQITVEFYIPAYKMDRTFAVLWWDETAGAWVEVAFELVPHPRMPGGKIVAHWPEPGVFILVER